MSALNSVTSVYCLNYIRGGKALLRDASLNYLTGALIRQHLN